MARSELPMRANGIELDPAAPLEVRARRMLEAFDAEFPPVDPARPPEGIRCSDCADLALRYADWFADLLDEYLSS